MNKKTGLFVGLGLVTALVALAAWFFVGSVTPYTTDFTVAKSGRQCQVNGNIIKNTFHSLEENGRITHTFLLGDGKGDSLPIAYSGSLPQNFEHSDTAVTTGVWNGKEFVTSQVLVKCPSKYEVKQ